MFGRKDTTITPDQLEASIENLKLQKGQIEKRLSELEPIIYQNVGNSKSKELSSEFSQKQIELKALEGMLPKLERELANTRRDEQLAAYQKLCEQVAPARAAVDELKARVQALSDELKATQKELDKAREKLYAATARVNPKSKDVQAQYGSLEELAAIYSSDSPPV
jgi:chromosome segregation ATPase